ncbi:hypothetical protein LTR27_000156 [Elasticomyces elasticus]|nr:hypothetical protein LTR27_000156 [Elasticomyces elasticus]
MSRHYSTLSHDSDMPLPLYTPTVTADYSTFVQNLPPPAYSPTSSVAGVYENVPPPSYTVAVPVERGWSLMALWHGAVAPRERFPGYVHGEGRDR